MNKLFGGWSEEPEKMDRELMLQEGVIVQDEVEFKLLPVDDQRINLLRDYRQELISDLQPKYSEHLTDEDKQKIREAIEEINRGILEMLLPKTMYVYAEGEIG